MLFVSCNLYEQQTISWKVW